MPFDSNQQRRIMGKFPTGVTVASTTIGDETWGMTANAVTSLSLDPPLVLLAVDGDSESLEKFKSGGCFALSILAAHQQAISTRFALTGPRDFSGLEVKFGQTGAPILADALAWVDCRLKEIVPGGDHDILIGEIVAGDAYEGQPLIFYSGNYVRLAE